MRYESEEWRQASERVAGRSNWRARAARGKWVSGTAAGRMGPASEGVNGNECLDQREWRAGTRRKVASQVCE